MPKLATPLTELQVTKAKPRDRAYKLADGQGLALVVNPSGSKAWTVRYRLPDGSRPSPVTIGHHPSMPLASARARALEIQRAAKGGALAEGIKAERRAAMQAVDAASAAAAAEAAETAQASFRAVSARWLSAKRPTWAVETFRKARLVVNSHLIPKLGDCDMRTLTTKEVRPVLLAMAAEVPQLARKARQYVQSLVEHAIDEGLRPDESSMRLNRVLPSFKSGHMAAVTDDDASLGSVMRAIDGYGNPVVRAALLLTAYTAIRPGVAASARWSEMDLDNGEWRIPGYEQDGTRRMKTGQDFSTSLSRQALAAVREMQARRFNEEYVFPAQARQRTPHLHRDALSKALRDMGFQGVHTTHGFRASLRTLGRERLGIEVDVLEAQLAHAPKDEVEAAYARVKFKEKRREVMQAWADYLDGVRDGEGIVVAFRKAG